MSMTTESKQYYIKLIHEIWLATQNYTADDVNEEAAEIAARVFREIVAVCRPIAIFEGCRKKYLSIMLDRKAPRFLAMVLYTFLNDLITAGKGSRLPLIIDSAAIKNRSMIEAALINL